MFKYHIAEIKKKGGITYIASRPKVGMTQIMRLFINR